MQLSALDNTLWAAGFIGHVALVLILLTRRPARGFPIFTVFVGYQALTTIWLFFVSKYGSRHGYFLAYWITGGLNYVFQVAVVIELARDALRPTGTWLQDAWRPFLAWGSASLGVSVTLALLLGPPQSKGFELWDARVTVFTSLLTCALFLSMSVSANLLGLQQRSYALGLGGGLFVWAFSSLLEEFGHALLGWNRQFVIFVYIREIIYLLVLLYWMVIFWFPEKKQAALSPEMKAYLIALHEQVQYDLKKIGGSGQ